MINYSPAPKGGKTIYGASVGILMLETRFPRIPGDMGNATSWPFPVLYRVVRGASPERVVTQKADGLLQQFIDCGRELVRDGADGITTNCGFLSLFQEELADALDVPVASSSLMQVPLIQRTLPSNKRVAILTISKSSLSRQHLQCAGCDIDTPIESTEGGLEFSRAILNDELTLEVEKARQDNLDAAIRLMDTHPETGAIVLECTNMVPYAEDIRSVTGVPVFSIYSFIHWFHNGLQPGLQ